MAKVVNVPLTVNGLRERILDQSKSDTANAQGISLSQTLLDPLAFFIDGAVKTTSISLGKDSRIGTRPTLVAPTIDYAEIKLDGLANPYVRLHFSIPRQIVEDANVIAFRIYRQRVPAENLDQKVDAFNKSDFDQISNKTTRTGKFANDNKAQFNIDSSLQPDVVRNVNQFTSNESRAAQNASQKNKQSIINQTRPSVTYDLLPTALATIKYADADAAAKLKQIYSQSKSDIALTYDDYNVTYGSGYVYSLTSISNTSQESSRSTSISLVLLNLKSISKPICAIKQVDEKSFQVACIYEPGDYVKRIYVYKRNTEDIRFHAYGVYENQKNALTFIDDTVSYLQTYEYRVLLENVFGAVSEPDQVKLTCSVQRVIDKTRSHNMSMPIFIASQDQNSDGIKITIFPNDNKVLYYEILRRNVTVGERRYNVPHNGAQELWASNKFFVKHNTPAVLNSGSIAQLLSGNLPQQNDYKTFSDPVVFVDSTVTAGNYYQYRVTGYDLCGNTTSCAFSSLAATVKNAVRTPVNFNYEILRETPFRIKLVWNDDNQANLSAQAQDAEARYLESALKASDLSEDQVAYLETLLTSQNLSHVDRDSLFAKLNLKQQQQAAIEAKLRNLDKINNPMKFLVQRRRTGATVYDAFPLTVNQFLIDEAPAYDAIPFSGSYVPDTYSALSSTLPPSGTIRRPFNLPDYLVNEQRYQYRIAVVGADGSSSEFSDPITVVAQAQLGQPVGLSASLLNPRVIPVVVKLEWRVDPLKGRPDHWRIERLINATGEVFQTVGNAYLLPEYFDRDAELNMAYTYRVRSVSAAGTETEPIAANIRT